MKDLFRLFSHPIHKQTLNKYWEMVLIAFKGLVYIFLKVWSAQRVNQDKKSSNLLATWSPSPQQKFKTYYYFCIL